MLYKSLITYYIKIMSHYTTVTIVQAGFRPRLNIDQLSLLIGFKSHADPFVFRMYQNTHQFVVIIH